MFADQSKAFERLGLHWFDKVLRGWNLPAWAVNSFGVMCHGRKVKAVGRPNATLRHLRRSIGMGGTSSPLSRCLAYDPVVEGRTAAPGWATIAR